jgi:putative oxidoreductase
MKVAALIARILLGLIFFVFGLNGFLNFISMGPMPAGLAGQYIGALMQSHYIYFVSALQVAGGLLLLIGRYVPMGLTLLGPVIVNILLYHILMDPKDLPMAIIVAILWGIVAFYHRQYFSGLFVQKTA